MLLGAIAGTIASGISFTSYGVLWAVGHAESLGKILWGKLTGSSEETEAGQGRSRRLGVEEIQGNKPERYKPEFFEPVTTGAATQAAVGLLKVFAALWAPILATVLQMASSRTREGHADEAGGLLTGDSESLALGLGLLTSWRPPVGYTVRREMLPIIASQAHHMTVNPVEQLHDSGALPKSGGLIRMVVGKADNWFFNLFITHPDTTQRIERLHDMAFAQTGPDGKKRD